MARQSLTMHDLGRLAGEFRFTKDLKKREEIAKEYREVAAKLKSRGKWEILAPEDELPDEYM